MKKYALRNLILMAVLILSGFASLTAQTTDEKSTFVENIKKISKSVTEMVGEINELVNQYRNGELSEEELEIEIEKLEGKIEREVEKIERESKGLSGLAETREETLARLEHIMSEQEMQRMEMELMMQDQLLEREIEREQREMEKSMREMQHMEAEENDSRIEMNDNSLKLKLKNNRPAKQTRKNLVVGFGPTYVIENNNNDNYVPDFKPWSSWSGYLGFQMATRFTPTSNVGIQYGILYKWMIMNTDNNAVLTIQDRNGIYVQDDNFNYNKSSLTTHHLVAPLMLQFSNKRGHGYTLGLGGYAGVRLGDTQKLNYVSSSGERVESKLKANYRTNPFIYGVGANFGKDFVRFFAHYDLSNVWRTEDNYDWNRFNFGFHLHF